MKDKKIKKTTLIEIINKNLSNLSLTKHITFYRSQ